MRLEKDAEVEGSEEDFSEVLRFARSALNLLGDLRIPPTPIRFTVVYWHETGRFADMSLAINRLVGHNRLDGVALDELHEQFFSEEDDTSGLRQASASIEKSIADIGQAVEDAQGAAKQFDGVLDKFYDELGVKFPPQFEGAVTSMRDATRQMQDTNRVLEERLRFSLREVELLQQHFDRLEREAILDPLTGIGNRKRFDKMLREAVARAAADSEPLSLLMIDIDYFKLFNDVHGHQTGDQVLKLVALQLTSATRNDSDTPARYGGEEFSVILPRTTLPVAVKLADKIRHLVADRKVTNRRTGHSLGQVTLSIGVSQFRPGETAAELVNRADEAMYLAKKQGRNRVLSELDLDGK